MTAIGNIYGFTLEIKNTNEQLSQETVNLITGIKASTLRVQVPAKHIMNGTIVDWSIHDQVYKLAEAAKLQLVFTLEDFDPAHDLAPGYTDPKVMAAYGAEMAKRYPSLLSIECGNEEIDGKKIDWKYMAEQIVATVPAIKAVNKNVLIGPGAFVGYHNSVAHITESITALWTGGAAQLLSYMQAHFYHGKGIGPDQSDGKEPSFHDVWSTIASVNAKHGSPKMPVWIGETNWTLAAAAGSSRNPANVVTEPVQWQYLESLFNETHASGGIVQKVLVYTIGSSTDSMSIASPTHKTTAYTQMGSYITTHP